MFLEVEYDHYESVSSAIKLSISSNICDKICLVSESGEQVSTSFSFISLFSKLIYNITKSIHEEIPHPIIVPLEHATIEDLMVLLSEGQLISKDIENLRDVFEAAKILDIDSLSWSIDIVENDTTDSAVPPPISKNSDAMLVKSITETPSKTVVFSNLQWSDCEIENQTHESEIMLEIKREVDQIDNSSGQCQQELPNVVSKDVTGVLSYLEVQDARKVQQKSIKKKRGRPKKRKNIKQTGPIKKIGRPKMMEDTDPLVCPECPRSFIIPSELNLHYASAHTEGNSYNCDKCKKRFKSKIGLQYHVISFHEKPIEVNNSCIVCGKIIVGSGRNEYIRKLSAGLKMKNHMRILHENKIEILSCLVCDKKFSSKNQFSKHMLKVHPKTAGIVMTKPVQCSQPGCERKYLHDKARRYHEKTHNPDEFKLSCQFCDLKFIHQSRLLQHQELHNPWRKCEDCGATLRSKNAFNIHIQRCRNDFRFPCESCDKKFVVKAKLDRHMLVHTREAFFSCVKCDKKYARKDKLKQPMKNQVCENIMIKSEDYV